MFGIAAFYTTPRYTADDYRSLIRQMVQEGDNQATSWLSSRGRSATGARYMPLDKAAGLLPGPGPLLLSDGAVDWSPAVAEQIGQALRQGAVWFPEPLTFGSSLPQEIEQYLGTVPPTWKTAGTVRPGSLPGPSCLPQPQNPKTPTLAA